MGYPAPTGWPLEDVAALREAGLEDVDITPFEDRRATREELEIEADRLVALGASVEKVLEEPWGPFEEFAIMMRDPEGNEFCLQ